MAENNRTHILLVEDNPGDIMLIKEAFAETDVRPTVACVGDGIEAMQFLRRLPPFQEAQKPDIVILDLNLPRKDGRTVLKEIKSDAGLATTPVIVLSGSDAPQDIMACYDSSANCFIVKPRDLFGMNQTIRSLVDFWFKTVKLPPMPNTRDS